MDGDRAGEGGDRVGGGGDRGGSEEQQGRGGDGGVPGEVVRVFEEHQAEQLRGPGVGNF